MKQPERNPGRFFLSNERSHKARWQTQTAFGRPHSIRTAGSRTHAHTLRRRLAATNRVVRTLLHHKNQGKANPSNPCAPHHHWQPDIARRWDRPPSPRATKGRTSGMPPTCRMPGNPHPVLGPHHSNRALRNNRPVPAVGAQRMGRDLFKTRPSRTDLPSHGKSSRTLTALQTIRLRPTLRRRPQPTSHGMWGFRRPHRTWRQR